MSKNNRLTKDAISEATSSAKTPEDDGIPKPITTYYDYEGNELTVPVTKENEINACAKKVVTGKNQQFFFKHGRYGLFQPKKSTDKYNLKAKDRATNTDMFKFHKTTQRGLTAYIRFLQQGSLSNLAEAEREIR